MTLGVLQQLAQVLDGIGRVLVMPAYPVAEAYLPCVGLDVEDVRFDRVSMTGQVYDVKITVRATAIASSSDGLAAYTAADDLIGRVIERLLKAGAGNGVSDITLTRVQYEQTVDTKCLCAAAATFELSGIDAWEPVGGVPLQRVFALYNGVSGWTQGGE